MKTLPFKEKIIEENEFYSIVTRSFSSDLTEDELVWHRDKEEREIKLIKGEGWYLQLDNQIPKLIEENYEVKIPKETWHRIINKNKTNLVLSIKKYNRW